MKEPRKKSFIRRLAWIAAACVPLAFVYCGSVSEGPDADTNRADAPAAVLIARCQQKAGDPQRAVELLTGLLPELELALNSDPFAIGADLRQVLGASLAELDRTEEARVQLAAAVEGYERSFGPNHPRAAAARAALANLLSP